VALAPGTRLGAYEVLSLIGSGGMGEVYRARDSRLNRDVAIKVLSSEVAADHDRLARFEREAQVLASLNHPNIANIYGVDDSSGTPALVMELVDGPTLADRIAKGPIPLDEALPIAKQIAEALEAAHEQGIIHRDLKPANIKVRPDGTVKVLDFGLAKALDPHGSSGTGATMSPTLSIHATHAGIILGTAAYMAPEQARGKAVDKRTDIWAFGVTVFETLTGQRVFEGETISDVLAKVIEREPDWETLPPQTPAAVRRLLALCVKKDPKGRLRDVGEARRQIEEVLAGASDAPSPPASRAVPWWRAAAPWLFAAGFGVVTLVMWVRSPTRSTRFSLRLRTDVGANVTLPTATYSPMALSPNGDVLVFAAPGGAPDAAGTQRLYVRRLDQLEAMPLAGTEGASGPFFSPDGQWIGFFTPGKLNKIPVIGGALIALCDAPSGRGGTWADDGTIIFSPVNGSGVSLMRVASSGGTPQPVAPLEKGEVTQRWPQALPRSAGVLFTSHNAIGDYEDANLVVQPLPSGARKVVWRGGYYGRYLPSGHLLYIRNSILFAVSFDLSRLEATGVPVPVMQDVTTNPSPGWAQFATSDSGTMVYVPAEQGAISASPIEWLDRDGNRSPVRSAPTNWGSISISPDGSQLALDVFDGKQWDIWIDDIARDSLSRVTVGRANNGGPIWTPDGERIVFSSTRGDERATYNLFWVRADGTSDPERLTTSRNLQFAGSWHPSGRFLAFAEQNPQTLMDLMILPFEGEEGSGRKPGKPHVFLAGRFNEMQPAFSPDGRWLAYVSDESGQSEVYVRPFPGPGGKWRVSSDYGRYPTWSRTRDELLYSTFGQQLMVVPFSVQGDQFHPSRPQPWSETRFQRRYAPLNERSFDLHPDGRRIALTTMTGSHTAAKADQVIVVLDFFAELRRIVPATRR
jgi:serine/threonine-protein kinase